MYNYLTDKTTNWEITLISNNVYTPPRIIMIVRILIVYTIHNDPLMCYYCCTKKVFVLTESFDRLSLLVARFHGRREVFLLLVLTSPAIRTITNGTARFLLVLAVRWQTRTTAASRYRGRHCTFCVYPVDQKKKLNCN